MYFKGLYNRLNVPPEIRSYQQIARLVNYILVYKDALNFVLRLGTLRAGR